MKLLSRIPIHFLILVVVSSVSCAWPEGLQGQSRFSARDFVGRWSGVREIKEGRYTSRAFVHIEISIGDEGRPYLRNASPVAFGEKPTPAEISQSGIVAEWKSMFGKMHFSGELSRDRKMYVELSQQLFASTDDAKVTLYKDNPSSAKYLFPRVDDSLQPVRHYSYQQPELSDDWPDASVVDEAIDVAPVEEMVEKILKSDTDHLQNRTDSILIVRNGHLVLEEYFWGADRNQPHQISSDTKSLTSMLFGLACDKGLLEVEQKTISFFKDYPDTVWVKNKYAITLDNLLSMEANVEWNEDLPYQDPRNTAIGLVNADDPIQYVLNRPRIGPPGARYKYNSGLPNLIGDVLRRSIGEPLEEFAEHELFSILDIKNYRWARQKNGEILSAGGFSMRPIDAAKLGQLMLDKGVWRGRQIISQDWVDRSTRRQTGVDDYAYGYYWHLGDQQNKKLAPWEGYMAIGQGGQYIIVIPSAKVVVVLNSSNWQPGGTELAFNEIIQPFILPSIKQAVRR